MKKTIYFILAAVMLLSGCAEKADESQLSESTTTNINTQEETTETEETTTEKPTDRIRDIESIEDFEYEIIDGGVTITKYTGTSTDITVPETIEDTPVKRIGFFAFEAQFAVQSVTLPDTVEVICEGAFIDCASMRTINIPESVTGIERSAFAACTGLESIVIPASVQSIDMEAFTACENMTSLTINNPSLEYADWGLEELPNLTIYASADSAIYKWASENGLTVSAL